MAAGNNYREDRDDIAWNIIKTQVNSDSPFKSIVLFRYILKGLAEVEKLQIYLRWLKEKADEPNILIPIR